MAFGEGLWGRRKDPRLLVGGPVLLLALATAVYVLLLRGRGLPDALIANRVLLFVLWYVDVVLILAVAFVLARNLVKLVLERRSGLLGSKFKTKLVATYVGLALLPGMLLFVLAAGFLRGSIARWFDTPLDQVLAQAAGVARQLEEHVARSTEGAARRVAAELANRGSGVSGAGQAGVGVLLQQSLGEQDLDLLALYTGTTLVQAVVNPGSGLVALPEPGRAFLAQVVESGQGTRIDTPRGFAGRLVLAGAGVRASEGDERSLVIAGKVLDRTASAPSAELVSTYQSYRQLLALQDDLQMSYVLLFLMVTLLILLASSWTGLYLARRITQPIAALVHATERVSSGELAHRVEAVADDELRVLVESFNRMTAEIERNEALLGDRNAALAATNQRLAAVLANVAAGVVSLDADGRIFTCNEAALAMLRQREEQVLGRLAAEVWGSGPLAPLLALVRGVPDGRPHELRVVLGGEWRTFEVKVTAIRDAAEREVSRVVVLEDLSELLQAQQLAAWNEAAKRIAHEINNPITPVRLSAERLLRKQGDPEFPQILAEGVETIVRGVGTIRAMVDEFAQYARMPRPQPREVDLGRLLRETVHLYEAIKPGVELVVVVDPELPAVTADAEQLRRAVINLLDNAIEATEAPGRVEVRAGPADGLVQIAVADSGRGIPPDAKEKLFLPYFSTKGRGTGLGLAIVHRIVTDHRGTIRVSDNAPQGTVFTIELPA